MSSLKTYQPTNIEMKFCMAVWEWTAPLNIFCIFYLLNLVLCHYIGQSEACQHELVDSEESEKHLLQLL